jgi:hypothetical protein
MLTAKPNSLIIEICSILHTLQPYSVFEDRVGYFNTGGVIVTPYHYAPVIRRYQAYLEFCLTINRKALFVFPCFQGDASYSSGIAGYCRETHKALKLQIPDWPNISYKSAYRKVDRSSALTSRFIRYSMIIPINIAFYPIHHWYYLMPRKPLGVEPDIIQAYTPLANKLMSLYLELFKPDAIFIFMSPEESPPLLIEHNYIVGKSMREGLEKWIFNKLTAGHTTII